MSKYDEDMGYLAEEACRKLAVALCPDDHQKRRALCDDLRDFMREAKKGMNL